MTPAPREEITVEYAGEVRESLTPGEIAELRLICEESGLDRRWFTLCDMALSQAGWERRVALNAYLVAYELINGHDQPIAIKNLKQIIDTLSPSESVSVETPPWELPCTICGKTPEEHEAHDERGRPVSVETFYTVHGDMPLSPEGQEAVKALAGAAFEKLASPSESVSVEEERCQEHSLARGARAHDASRCEQEVNVQTGPDCVSVSAPDTPQSVPADLVEKILAADKLPPEATFTNADDMMAHLDAPDAPLSQGENRFTRSGYSVAEVNHLNELLAEARAERASLITERDKLKARDWDLENDALSRENDRLVERVSVLEAAIKPFAEFYQRQVDAYKKRGGNADIYPDKHPSFDIKASELPLGLWRALTRHAQKSEGGAGT